jgi:chaperonin GroES
MAAKRKRKKILNLKPTPGYLVIEPLEAETKTASGIYLPESAGEKPQKGMVVAVGDDDVTEKGTKKKAPAKVGDTVIFKKWGGSEVKVAGVEYLFSKFEDILAVVK